MADAQGIDFMLWWELQKMVRRLRYRKGTSQNEKVDHLALGEMC